MPSLGRRKKAKLAPPAADPAEAECFPRGGRRTATSEAKRRFVEPDDVPLFGTKKKKQKTVRERPAKSDASREQHEDGRSVVCAQLLTRRRLSTGLKLLAVVKEIRELQLVVELPHGVRASVPLREVSDEIAELVDAFIAREEEAREDDDDESLPRLDTLFRVGDFVVGVVVRSEHDVELSLRASLLNEHLAQRSLFKGMVVSGTVRSREDHGYVINLGLPTRTGFLVRPPAETRLRRH
jgi:rRNA biogenesis protein RRP5